MNWYVEKQKINRAKTFHKVWKTKYNWCVTCNKRVKSEDKMEKVCQCGTILASKKD